MALVELVLKKTERIKSSLFFLTSYHSTLSPLCCRRRLFVLNTLNMSSLVEYATQNRASNIAFLVVAGVAVALRFCTKFIARISIGAEDWIVLLALVFFFIETVLLLVALSDIMDKVPPSIEHFAKLSYFSAIFYYLVDTTVRISVVWYYRRIFPIPSFRRLSMIMIGICILWCIPGFFLELFDCVPLSSYWDPAVSGRCINYMLYYVIIMSVEVVLDAAILVLPLKQVYRLQMTGQKKTLVCGIFLLGGFIVITNIIKTVWTYTSSPHKLNGGVDLLWGNIHQGTGILCACLPTYTPLVVKMSQATKSLWSSLTSRGSKASRDGSHSLPKSEAIEERRRSYYQHLDENSDENHGLESIPKEAVHGGEV